MSMAGTILAPMAAFAEENTAATSVTSDAKTRCLEKIEKRQVNSRSVELRKLPSANLEKRSWIKSFTKGQAIVTPSFQKRARNGIKS